MIVHLFNSSSVCGPETLVLPALASARTPCVIVNLREERINGLRESDPLKQYVRSLNLLYHAIPVRGRWDRLAMDELHRTLRRLGPELVHAHAIKASIYLLQARERAGDIHFSIVSTHHGIHALPDWKMRLYEQLYRRHFLKSFDRALAVSSADYDIMLNSGLNKDRLRLHLNGVDRRWVSPAHRAEESQKARARWLPQELNGYRPFLFGVIARLSSEKDHERVLRVLSCLNQLASNRDWKCLIFGTGLLKDSLHEQAIHLGLEKRVLWMGYRDNVADELAGLDLLLSFSKAEGLPINLIEAGWAGTPVMGTRIGGVTDLIPDESFGHLIDPGEQAVDTALSLLQVLSQEGHAALTQQARRFQNRVITEFTQKKWLERLATIYSELGVAFDVQGSAAAPQESLPRATPMGVGAALRLVSLLLFGILPNALLARAEIPQPPVLLLTAQENGTESQNTFSCSNFIYGYVTLPKKASGKHLLEGIWTGPRGTVVQHSRNEVSYPAPGRRSADVWLRFTKEGGHLWNPVSVQTSGDADRLLYDGSWNLEVRWDERTVAQSPFKIQCKYF